MDSTAGSPLRLEFAAFSVKSMRMTSGGNGIDRSRPGGRLLLALALACGLACSMIAAPVSAQMFSERPPPVPPASVPEAPSGPAINLAPPSGPASISDACLRP